MFGLFESGCFTQVFYKLYVPVCFCICDIFQFSQSIQKALQAVMVLMATFSECYEEPSQVMQIASSLLNSGKYVMDQELRARQVCCNPLLQMLFLDHDIIFYF